MTIARQAQPIAIQHDRAETRVAQPARATVLSLATAVPGFRATGSEVYSFLVSRFAMPDDQRDLYHRLLVDGPIRGRHLAMDGFEDGCRLSVDEQHERFRRNGIQLACQAGRQALAEAGLKPAEVGGLVVNTCTGYLCPGLSSYVSQELGLPERLCVLDLMGMGCGAAVPNLQAAVGLLAQAGPTPAPVLSISVEICSATLFLGPQPDQIVSNCIFADGASAAVVGPAASQAGPGLCKVVDLESGLFPRYREDLRYRQVEGRLCNSLSRRVPIIAARAVNEVLNRLLRRHGLETPDIQWWAVHPGGTSVLSQVARELSLPPEATRFSQEVFAQYGNMSSPSVMFVLRAILDSARPAPGQLGVMLTFGAGFTAFAALVEF